MQHWNQRSGAFATALHKRPWMHKLALVPVAAIGLTGFALPANPGQQTPNTQLPDRTFGPTHNSQAPDPTGPPDISDAKIKEKMNKEANIERQKQIAEESAKLLKLATDLKAEVDKTNKDMLSVTALRKADEIEKLAHSVREKMKLEFIN
jgi:hypothetical protein